MAWFLLVPFAIVIGLYLRSLQQRQARRKKIASVMQRHRATQLSRQHKLPSAPERGITRKKHISAPQFFHSPNANSKRITEVAKDLRQAYPEKSEAWIWDETRRVVGKQALAAKSQVKPITRSNPDEHLKAPYRRLVAALGDKKVAEELVVSRIKQNQSLSLESAIEEALSLIKH